MRMQIYVQMHMWKEIRYRNLYNIYRKMFMRKSIVSWLADIDEEPVL
jgi:hypothetical protein